MSARNRITYGDAVLLYAQSLASDRPAKNEIWKRAYVNPRAVRRIKRSVEREGLRSPDQSMRNIQGSVAHAAYRHEFDEFIAKCVRSNEVTCYARAPRKRGRRPPVAPVERDFWIGRSLYEGNLIASGLGNVLLIDFEFNREELNRAIAHHKDGLGERKPPNLRKPPARSPGRPSKQGAILELSSRLWPGGHGTPGSWVELLGELNDEAERRERRKQAFPGIESFPVKERTVRRALAGTVWAPKT